MTRSKQTHLTEENLDALFDAVQRTAPDPSGTAMARWVADAEAAAAGYVPQIAPQNVSPAPQPPMLKELWAGIGGWIGGFGLATATVAGVALGFNPPEAMTTLLALGADDSYLVSLTPDLIGLGFEEGL